jgi:methionine-rich copper-binding protein CopC
MLRTALWIALLALLGAGLFASAELALAHADYERSQPAQNEVLPDSPEQVDVWFTQEVFKREGENFVRVFDEQNAQVSEGDGEVDDDDRSHVFTTLPPGLQPGRYIVRWKTLSDIDGDRDEGAFCFYVAVEPTADQEADCAELSGEEEEPPPPTSVAAPTAIASDGDADGDGDGAPAAAIIGGVVAAIVAVVAVAGGFVLWRRSSA